MNKYIKKARLKCGILSVILSLLTFSPCVASAQTQGNIISQDQVRYTGRFDFSDTNGPIFAWSGSSIAISFKGTEISARLRPASSWGTKNWVNIIVDNNTPVALNIDQEKDYVLASNLTNGVHKVEIIKRTEPLCGELQFMGFELPSGSELLAPPAHYDRKIEFIGDSITCGYGNEAKGIEDGFKESQENNYLAYGPITARNLNAECVIAAWSGKGMYQGYGGAKDQQIPVLYTRTLPERSTSTWDFKSWTPDAVVINLGTNDFSTDINASEFSSKYKQFVSGVRTNYPKAQIFCTIGPMLQTPGQYISKIVKELNDAGDKRVYYFEFPAQDINANGVGGDWHPSLKTHAIMADALTKQIKAVLDEVPDAKGDVNADGKVDVVDATMLKAYVIKKKDESIFKRKIAADINCDGVINSIDYLLLKKIIQS